MIPGPPPAPTTTRPRGEPEQGAPTEGVLRTWHAREAGAGFGRLPCGRRLEETLILPWLLLGRVRNLVALRGAATAVLQGAVSSTTYGRKIAESRCLSPVNFHLVNPMLRQGFFCLFFN